MLKLFWVGFVIAFVFLQVVTGFLDFNETELSFIEAYDYGVSKLNYNPLMVGLTLIPSAGSKGAGTFLDISFLATLISAHSLHFTSDCCI